MFRQCHMLPVWCRSFCWSDMKPTSCWNWWWLHEWDTNLRMTSCWLGSSFAWLWCWFHVQCDAKYTECDADFIVNVMLTSCQPMADILLTPFWLMINSYWHDSDSQIWCWHSTSFTTVILAYAAGYSGDLKLSLVLTWHLLWYWRRC